MPEEINPLGQQSGVNEGAGLSGPNAAEVGRVNPQAIPADQLASAGSVDDEVERMMREEMAGSESKDRMMPGGESARTAGSFDQTIVQDRDLPSVKPVQFGQFNRTTGADGGKNIDIIMDVKLPVSIELGRTEMTIHDILGLSTGSVVELDRLAGEPVDLLVNNKVIARGEVVVVDETSVCALRV